MKHIIIVMISVIIGINLFGQTKTSIKLVVTENEDTFDNSGKYIINTYLWSKNDTLLIGNGSTINPPKNYNTDSIVGIFLVVNQDIIDFYNNQMFSDFGLPDIVFEDLLHNYQEILYQRKKWLLNIDYFPYSNFGNQLLAEEQEMKKGNLYKNMVIYQLDSVGIPVLNSKLVTKYYTSEQTDSISKYELVWLNSLKTHRSIVGTVSENFNGGWDEYQKIFLSKIKYPNELNTKKIKGSVYFEIEIDTNGEIVNFKILNSDSKLMDKEIENKINLTSGKWKTIFKEGKKTNYFIIEIVDF